MATARRAYTAEYSFDWTAQPTPEVQPERVRRTRQRPEVNREQRKEKQSETLSPATLRVLILGVVAIGIMLIGIVLVNAQAAKLQYSINQLRSSNGVVQSEIDGLKMRIESSTTIQQLETYATEELAMHYPSASEAVHLSTVQVPEDTLADLIRQKAYE